ncbi:RNA-binding protein 25 isoform X5 [Salmo salar]|uniref:RNA-binding protein 25 isoform X5 n=1 Tax=Salmo salar TaxID=8030 RepID=A0ABM3DVR9_SALSA|nr:RNA-binding protein 25 isoform X5 [Salmo salar]
MSYPPHLNRLPQLPPGIRPPQFAGFPQGVPAGTPMIPVHMGIMTSAPTVLVPTTVSMVQKPPAQRKDLNPVRAKEIQEGGSGGPTTTVFVGNISEKASDMLVRQLLAKCGLVLSWKRVQGASGKLQAFGFCEYKEPESTLRSLRLLHELLLGDKKLLVKVDAKTKAQLEEWKAKRRSANGGAMSEDGLKEEEEEEEEDLDEDTKRRDQIVKGAIEGLIREYGSELNAPSQDGDNQPRKKKREKKEEEDINVMEMEDDKRDLISREISKFRDTHKKLEEEKGKKEQERQEIDKDRRERDKERERERERRDREREKEKERNDNNNKDRDRDRIDRERERTKERERERGERERGERERGERERGERERGERERGERERVKERSREVSKDRSRSRERSRDEKKHDREEDQEEAYERRKLERKMRDKETAYQERLKNWEIRERKKARDYDKENQREEERRHEMTKEGKRLKEFLEDYDDDRDESKYYRGSALQKRLRDREKETELDDRDRKREKEEHDQIRQRLLAEGHPDPEAELQRMEEEAERRRQPPVKPEPEEEEEEEVQQEKPHREREHREREHREREHREREHREREHREREHREREHRERDRRGGGGADRPPPEHPQSQSDDDVEDGEELDDRDGEDSSDARTHPHLKPTLRPITSAPSVSSGSGGATPNSPGNESPCGIIIPHENSPEAQPTDEHRPKIGLSLKLGAGASPNHQIHTGSKRKKLANVDSVFNKFGEEEADEAPRKRKLVPLDYGEDDKSLGLDGAEVPGGKGGQNTEEKRKHIRSLIEKIPTARPELFNYPLDWTAVDSTLMDRRIRPWINKKIIEYIGEEEATLVDFVCSKVMSHGTPQGILDDVAMVLDEEAEVFIVKMWRLLIYETEAKKIGLGK